MTHCIFNCAVHGFMSLNSMIIYSTLLFIKHMILIFKYFNTFFYGDQVALITLKAIYSPDQPIHYGYRLFMSKAVKIV